MALVAVLAAGGGVATALFVVPRATGALRAVTASTVYADPDESPAEAGEVGEPPAPGEASVAEREIPVGDPPREPLDVEHEREQLAALAPAEPSRKLATNPPIVLDAVEIELVEGARPWVIHRLVPGETLEQVAWRYEVTPEALRTWNGLAADGKPLETGARVKVEARRVPPPRQQVSYTVQPGDSWWSIATAHAVDSKDLRAANPTAPARLTVGDALVLWIDPAVYHWVRTDLPSGDDPAASLRRGAVGVGAPWDGRLVNGVAIPAGERWRLQEPAAAYGTTHAVASLVTALQVFATTSTHERPLLVGAMSLRHGGPLPDRRSHQTGRDVDIRLPLSADIPAWFPVKPWRVDYEALWALVAALADTGEIEAIFLDYELQKGLHKAATKLGTDEDTRRRLIQWPHGRADGNGLVRHADGQTTQLHVRFRCGHHETECVGGDPASLEP